MSGRKARLYLDSDTGRFVVENYNWARPFSNFLPGIAGRWGVPLWLYYVNRGQVVSSMGVKDKNGQILEFYSFNKACMRIFQEGFRTFLREARKPLYEPFRKRRAEKVSQILHMGRADLSIEETDPEAGWQIRIDYFPLPNLPFAALVRRLSIRNLTRRSRTIAFLDGAVRVLPTGVDLQRIKGIPRHIEGMMGVERIAGCEVFRLRQTPDDKEEVGKIEGGNFFLPVSKNVATAIVDPRIVFDDAINYDFPYRFDEKGTKVLKEKQYRLNKTPCALCAGELRIGPGEETVVTTLIGYADSDDRFTEIRRLVRRNGFLDRKEKENRAVLEEIAQHAFTASADPVFDAYCAQDFLDNVIRGGMPEVFDTVRGKSAFYIYSRQNGDLERDYHFFVVEPTYLSQGNGHYRSVLQNRRTDTWFFPEVEDANLATFMNLIQLDGYNPLEVKTMRYLVADEVGFRKWLKRRFSKAASRRKIEEITARPFTPGGLAMAFERAGEPKESLAVLLPEAMRYFEEDENGGLHEGFWVDHWHYNLDLIDIYRMVYPERTETLFFGKRDYSFFDDPDVIRPRSEKCVDAGGKIRRYGAVWRDPAKVERIAKRKKYPYRVRTKYGAGKVYLTSLFVKFLCIVTNRLATLDPAGVGMDMEAGKPGWNDSMNGLPGLFGSALCETLELRKAVALLLSVLDEMPSRGEPVYEELAEFIEKLEPVIRRRIASSKNADSASAAAFRYWDEANAIKERYRERTYWGVSGKERRLHSERLRSFLEAALEMLDGIFEGPLRKKVLSPEGVPYTYFVSDAKRVRSLGKKDPDGRPLVKVEGFRTRPVRLFLEGAVHWMRVRPHEAESVYRAVRRSPLFDRKLRMYKSCENMEGESFELGRAVGAYPRGWIENESIYLHMEYKYLLEILRSGLCEAFWRDARTTLMPFLDPAVYGRSTLEGASFIVSSAYHDPTEHGRAYQPRLSGLTCEFLHIWILAVAGEKPFAVERDGGGAGARLRLNLRPRLPGWLFTKKPIRRRYLDPVEGWREILLPENTFAFKFLGRMLVVYYNPKRRDTFGSAGVVPEEYRLTWRDGRRETFSAVGVRGEAAEQVRTGAVRRIDVYFGDES